jgi:hypothetical protein
MIDAFTAIPNGAHHGHCPQIIQLNKKKTGKARSLEAKINAMLSQGE